jgi:hypothetical protein
MTLSYPKSEIYGESQANRAVDSTKRRATPPTRAARWLANRPPFWQKTLRIVAFAARVEVPLRIAIRCYSSVYDAQRGFGDCGGTPIAQVLSVLRGGKVA